MACATTVDKCTKCFTKNQYIYQGKCKCYDDYTALSPSTCQVPPGENGCDISFFRPTSATGTVQPCESCT